MAAPSHPMIFVNLPVEDVGRSRAFFTALGWSFNEQFTGEQAGCLVISDTIYAMLTTRPFFASLTPKQVADPATTLSAILALSCASRDEVDQIADRAFAAGATSHEGPEDQGFMYARSFYDLDGHGWNVFWMDPAVVAGDDPGTASAEQAEGVKV